MYWNSGSAWHIPQLLYAYSGSGWQEAKQAYFRSGSAWYLVYNSGSYYVKVSDNADSTVSIDCLGTPYASGLVYRKLIAELVDIDQNLVSNTFGSNITVDVQFDTYYNNNCGSPGTTSFQVVIPPQSSSGETVYVSEQVAECGFGCNTEGVNNPCIISASFSIEIHPSSSLGSCS